MVPTGKRSRASPTFSSASAGSIADQTLAQIDEHVHVAAADVVRIDLVAAEEQLVRALVRVLVRVRILVRLLAHQVVDPHHRVERFVVDAAARAEDDVQIGDLGRRQREARQRVLLEAERFDAPPFECAGAQQAERLQSVRRAADFDFES